LFSAYSIIIVLFIASGALLSVWGWSSMRRTRQRLAWPTVTGCVSRSDLQSPDDPLLPLIEYRYQVDGKDYQAQVQFPSATSPSEELSKSYVARYPMNQAVKVYYQAQQPEQSTLEPRPQGDWLILAIGVVTMVLGVIFLISPLIG